MSKLIELLAEQEKVTGEVAGLAAFLDQVHGKAPLVMVAGSETIEFEAKELGLELQIIDLLNGYYQELTAKKEKADAKVAALETLVS